MWEHDYVVNGYSWDNGCMRLFTNSGVVTCWDYLADITFRLLKDKEQNVTSVNGVTVSRLRYGHRIRMSYNTDRKMEVVYNGIC